MIVKITFLLRRRILEMNIEDFCFCFSAFLLAASQNICFGAFLLRRVSASCFLRFCFLLLLRRILKISACRNFAFCFGAFLSGPGILKMTNAATRANDLNSAPKRTKSCPLIQGGPSDSPMRIRRCPLPQWASQLIVPVYGSRRPA